MKLRKVYLGLLAVLITTMGASAEGITKKWTLKECLDYAKANNITVQKSRVSEASAKTDVLQAKAALRPTLSANMTQMVNYRPLQESMGNFINGNTTSSSGNKVTQSGSYGINASWKVWDGGVTRNTIRLRESDLKTSQLQTETEIKNIEEQIAELYIQILYSKEAIKVNDKIYAKDSLLYVRGESMLKNGKMSRSEVKELEAAMNESKYNVVKSQTVTDGYLLQLRQLLELQPGEKMDVADTKLAEEAALSTIPSKLKVYEDALKYRPEILFGQENINSSALQLKIAKAGFMPQVSLTGGIGDNHMSGTNDNFGKQMKTNLTGSVGITLSIPIVDGRQTKSAIEKAQYAQTTATLDLQDLQKQLYSKIETYQQNAISNQQRYRSAMSNVSSQEENYNSIAEQFKVGLKSVVEVTTARASLLSAEQEMLESKYSTLLNLAMLNFYSGGQIKI